MPPPGWGASASLGCQSESRTPERIQDARTNPGCPSQSGLPGPVWDARANQDAKASLGCECQSDEDATLRMLRSHLCNSICCALLLHSNRSALVYIYIYIYISIHIYIYIYIILVTYIHRSIDVYLHLCRNMSLYVDIEKGM